MCSSALVNGAVCLLNVDFTGHLDKTLLLAMNLEKELKKAYTMYNTNCDPTKLKEKESRSVVYTSYTQLTVCCVTNYICLLYQLYLVLTCPHPAYC